MTKVCDLAEMIQICMNVGGGDAKKRRNRKMHSFIRFCKRLFIALPSTLLLLMLYFCGGAKGSSSAPLSASTFATSKSQPLIRASKTRKDNTNSNIAFVKLKPQIFATTKSNTTIPTKLPLTWWNQMHNCFDFKDISQAICLYTELIKRFFKQPCLLLFLL